MNYLILFVFLSTVALSLGSADYYWREYNYKEIPSDAVVAGTDRNGNNIYIGQVNVLNEIYDNQFHDGYKGIVPALIKQCNPVVYAELGKVSGYQQHIKILAGPRGHFQWYPSTSAHFKDDMKARTPVRGGYELKNSALLCEYYIGRGTYGGETVVGKILSTTGEFIYADPYKKTQKTNTYEVLIFNDHSHKCGA